MIFTMAAGCEKAKATRMVARTAMRSLVNKALESVTTEAFSRTPTTMRSWGSAYEVPSATDGDVSTRTPSTAMEPG